MKKILVGALFALLMVTSLLGVNAKEKAKVKVYIFEAGGCPYCEAEVEYLKGLDSYNKKFTIERRELYVDHVDWAKGRDYELGKAVAEKFQKDGFEDASYSGTPFVVISDLYAAATYSTSLESYINSAYENGDKDVVSKIAKELKVDNVNRTDIGETEEGTEEPGEGEIITEYKEEKPNALIVLGVFVVLAGAVVAVLMVGGNKDNVVKEETKPEEKEKPVKKVVKKVPAKKEVKKTEPKKTSTKKVVKKTSKK